MIEDAGPHISIAGGIIIGLLASCVQSLGLTVQRKSHLLDQACSEEDRRPDYRRPLWLVGFSIFISSNILGSIFQIASLPVVILAPLGAVSLLWNAFFARLILGDVFSKYMVLGTLFIATGAVLIAVFGIVPEPTHSLDDLLRLFRRPTFVAYFSLLAAAVLIVLIITHLAEWKLTRQGRIRLDETPPTSPHSPTHPEPNLENGAERSSSIDPKMSPARLFQDSTAQQRTITWIAISYGSASGLLSGMCLLFAKSGVELLLLSFAGYNQFWRWESWILVLGLVIFALLQLWYLHKSLILADPTLVCPLAFCSYNLSSIINGLVYFNQISELTGLQLGLVSFGIAVLLGGVWAVSVQEGGGIKEGAWVEEDGDDADVERTGAFGHTFSGSEHSLEPILDSTRPLAMSRQPVNDSPRDSSLDAPASPIRTAPLSPVGGSSPRLHIRTGSLDASSSPPVSPQRRSHPRPRYGTLLGAEAPAGALVTPGFSIGLSPVSPGFALIPQARRRFGLRSISEGSAGAEASNDSRERTVEDQGHTSRRRWRWIKNVGTSSRGGL